MDTEQLAHLIIDALENAGIKSLDSPSKRNILILLEGYIDEIGCIENIGKTFEGNTLSIYTDSNSTLLKPILEKQGTFMGTLNECEETDDATQLYDAVVYPFPSLKRLARIARLTTGDVLSDTVYSALCRRKRVLMGSMSENKRMCGLPSPLLKEAAHMYEKLKEYGIEELQPSQKLFSAADCGGGSREVRLEDRLITLQDVENRMTENQTLLVRENQIFTPLAIDYIKQKKVIIKRQS